MKLTKSVPIVLVALVLLVASACGGGGAAPTPTPTPTPTAAPAYKTHTNVVRGFSISYPGDWVEAPGVMALGALAAYRAPSACGGGFANMNVLREDLPVSMSLQDFWEANQPDLATIQGYAPISEEEITLCGLPAIKHVCTTTMRGTTAKHVQAFLVEGKVGWLIMCSTAADCWNQYEPVFDAIINSFELLD